MVFRQICLSYLVPNCHSTYLKKLGGQKKKKKKTPCKLQLNKFLKKI
jgi:hypothetical protein